MAETVSLDPRNANKGTERGEYMVEHSLRTYGAGRAPVADKNKVIIAGNKTVAKAMELGIPIELIESDGKTLYVIQRTDLDLDTDPAAMELGIVDNRSSEVGLSWDADVLTALQQDGADLSAFWYDDELLAVLEPETTVTEGLTDPDAVPDPPKKATTKPGDLWVLGRHRLLCGDSRDFAHVTRLFDGASANVVVTSPPYASQRTYDESSGFKPIPPDQYGDWFRDVATNIMAILSADGSYFLNIKEHCDDGQRSLYVKDLTLSHVREWGWWFVDEYCWQRSALPGLFGPRFKNEWEPVFHFTRGEPKFRPQHVIEDADLSGLRTYDETAGGVTRTPDYNGKGERGGVRSKIYDGALPGNVITANKSGGVDHGAQFPVGLPTFFLRAFSDSGDIAFDPFMGSGTTLIAAEQENRVCYGMEISPIYCDVIVNRWQNFTGQAAELAATS
jgi:DNA modification methylase